MRICASVLMTALTLGIGCDDDEPTGDQCTSGTSEGCPAGQICTSDHTCVPATSGTIVIGASQARSCELLLEQRGTTIVGADWGDGVRGALRERPPNVAIAISRSTDAPFGDGAVTLELDGALSGVSLEQMRCFDASGAVIANPDVELGAGS